MCLPHLAATEVDRDRARADEVDDWLALWAALLALELERPVATINA